MYVAVRRYEGVTDTKKVAELAREGFIPIISEMPGFLAYYLSTPVTAYRSRPASSSTRTPRSSRTSGLEGSWPSTWPPCSPTRPK